MDYQLTVRALAGGAAVRRITADPAGLAQAVHHHVRGILGSSRVDIRLDANTLTGHFTNHGAHAGTFGLHSLLEPDRIPGPDRSDGLRWGWEAADIDDITRHALIVGRWRAADLDEQRAEIRYAIIEHLLTCEDAPSRRDLMAVGLRAGDDRVAREMHHHGWDRDNITAGRGGMPSFQRYWITSPTPGPEQIVVDRLALQQILPKLTLRQQRALEVLRDTGDYHQSARLLHLQDGSYTNLLAAARTTFRDWWHEGEVPSRHWRQDQRTGAYDGTCRGTPRLTTSQVEAMRDRRARGALLRELADEYGVGTSTVSRFLRGTARPAPDREEAAA